MENKEKLENTQDEDIFDEEYDDYEDADVELKPTWQLVKESWYSQLNVSVKQLDIIITLGVAGLIILAVVIGLDAAGVF
ncbi:MAG: hypothetical protein IKU54_07375 [Oscillospiraceae bacterium]|nr:hypothetical protein [Oscillospiraceae bacterium]